MLSASSGGAQHCAALVIFLQEILVLACHLLEQEALKSFLEKNVLRVFITFILNK